MEYKFTRKPCDSGAEWLSAQPDAKTAWDACERGDWMWWALRSSKNSIPEKETSIKFARWCAERAKKYAAAADAYVAADAADAYVAAAAAAYAYAAAAA